MAIEAVIFDLDGTLANFNLEYKALRSEARGYLMREGVPPSILNVSESIFEMLKKVEIFMKNNSKSTEAFIEVRTQVLTIAEKYEMEAANTTSLITGAVETLKDLEKMNLKIGLCTTSSEKAANYILNRFKISCFFKVAVSRNRVRYVKPHTEQFELALKTLRVPPKSAVIVGDSNVDMQSAKELEAIGIGFPTGFSSTQKLMSSGANYIITTLSDLPVLIKKLNEN